MDDDVTNWGLDIRVAVNQRIRDGGSRRAVEESSQLGQEPMQGGEAQMNAAINTGIQTVTTTNNTTVIVAIQKRNGIIA